MKPEFYKAAPNQVRHWRHFLRYPKSPALNMTVALYLEGSLNIQAMRIAAGIILNKHKSLRSIPLEINGELFWEYKTENEINFNEIEIFECKTEEVALEEVRKEGERPFSLLEEFPSRFRILTLPENANILLLNIHHITLDGWSADLLVKEIAESYSLLLRGEKPKETAPVYQEFADYQNSYRKSKEGEFDSEYWKTELQSVPKGIGFPYDLDPSENPEFPKGKMTWAFLSEELTNRVRSASKLLGLTPFVILLSAYGRLVGRVSGAQDFLVGIPYVNRFRVQDRELVGFLVNTLPFRFTQVNIQDEHYIQNVANTARNAFLHQRLPYIEILRDIGPDYESGSRPAFRSMFILQSTQAARNPFENLSCKQAWVSTGGAKYDQTWTIEERRGRYTLDLEWNPNLYSEKAIRNTMEEYVNILSELVYSLINSENDSAEDLDWREAARLNWPSLDTLSEIFEGPVILERCLETQFLASSNGKL
ncbi:hypothetical protein CH373_05300 [Leptospira perolatii]|uniref:Condensation domain-containing protein n=1 Tax=Leptospira perolatii TaxID=2023191 RepID=A0A2M9ZQJ8_9LEPT|nr:condensation domain-containing protein [Leptospira perolatii]PJZ70488.1 hypothetical protein CH360_05720 [Leptospira perolatii]PJZ74324.1 hypothetical protein CH373_05300 [Leptospira perolatii]